MDFYILEGMIRKLTILLLLLLLSPSWGQDCDENMILYDCAGEEFCNDQSLYGFDCYVANDLCEDFNGDGIISDWIGDGYCDDGTWGVDFQCDEYGWDCGDCGGEIVDPNGYCGAMGSWETFIDNGQIRDYYLYKPDSVEEDAALVFVLHGYSGAASGILNYSNMNSVADANGFIAVYPNGTQDQSNNRFWNVGYAFHDNQTVDDVGFLSNLAAYIQSEHGASPEKTFVTGMSNGGDMSYMLACQAPDVFSAVAPVAGCMMTWLYDSCEGNPPVPVLEIHGTNDNVTWWEGDPNDVAGWGPYMGTEEGIDLWVEKNSCTDVTNELLPNTAPNDGSTIISHKHTGCVNDNEVWLYEIVGGGHDWPGSGGNMDIDSSEEIWSFFNIFIDTGDVNADINQDGQINVADIVILVSIILGNADMNDGADLNEDGLLNILDVVVLINIILGN